MSFNELKNEFMKSFVTLLSSESSYILSLYKKYGLWVFSTLSS